ncbi:hypothetical protein Nmel_007495, partial [Mimus melanotis]
METFHPHGNTNLFKLGKSDRNNSSWAQQMAVSHQCLLKSIQLTALGITTLGLRRLGALFDNSGWDLGNAAPPRDLRVPQRRRTPSLGHYFDLQTKDISLTTLFPPCHSATELCLHLTPT